MLPKVRWGDLWDDALTSSDRALIPMSGDGRRALKTPMNERLKAVGTAVAKATHGYQAMFCETAEGAWNVPWIERYHETLFRQRRRPRRRQLGA